MSLSTKQKAYASVLAMVVIALVADRLFLPGPGEAAGTTSVWAARSAGSTSGADTGAMLASPISPQRSLLAARLDAVAQARGFDLENVPDAFEASVAWLEPDGADQGVDPGPPGGTRAGLRLNAVMAQCAAGYENVNGKTLFIGGSLNGYRLLAVYDRSAILESPTGMRIELTLAE